jgi:hypothetical protein
MSMDDLKDRVRLREPASSVESAEPVLLVDDVPVRYGRFPDGTFFLYENAYVWSDDLLALGRQLIVDRADGSVPVPPGQTGAE